MAACLRCMWLLVRGVRAHRGTLLLACMHEIVEAMGSR